MRDKLREILEYFNSVGNKGSGDIDYAVDEILDLLDKSLPGSKPFGKGYNQALADVRKVIEEKTND